MAKRIARGQPLTELVKGSMDYTMQRIRSAFREQFRSEDRYWTWWIVETFADHVIVQDDSLPPDEFWKVSYSVQSGAYVFALRGDWELVELSYQSRTANERRQMLTAPSAGMLFVERMEVKIEEAEQGKPRRITGRGMTAGIINDNNRRYAREVLETAIDEARARIKAGTFQMLGEDNHPSDKGGVASLLETFVLWDYIGLEGNEVILSGTIIETTKGRDAIILLDAGVRPRLSQRAHGMAVQATEGGRTFSEVVEVHLTGYDFVMNPGDPTAQILTVESRQATPATPVTPAPTTTPTRSPRMDLEIYRKRYPALVQQIELETDETRRAQLVESLKRQATNDESRDRQAQELAERESALRKQLGLKDTDDLGQVLAERERQRQQLEEAQRQREVEEYVAGQTADIKYPERLKAKFLEALKKAAPKTIEEAKDLIAAKRGEYDALMADIELAGRGFGGVTMLGSVLERERGVPEFARAAFTLTESLVTLGRVKRRDLRAPRTPSEHFAAKYLEAFDRKNLHHLQREAQQINEASTTADLNLPYSVSRAVMAEALPLLVAASVYDVQMTDQAPARIYFERYAGESGSTVTITDAAVNASNPLGSFVSLAHKRLQLGTVVVTNNAGDTTYVEGTDYVIDYVNGKIKALTGGAITAGQALKVDYVYDAIRKVEMQSIERAKMQLVHKTLEIAFDRLATQISREAIVFSRSQIGYDVVTRTLMRLIETIQRKIDRNMFGMGLMACLQVPNNSGGTWNSSSGTLDDLVRMIGVARVKLANRYYQPTAIVMSLTNSDRIANWDNFTAQGQRPDADLTAEGYVGRLKGLPVFETTEFSDSYIKVVNRELVMHRTHQTMELRGPFPTYDPDGELIAADQYYAEEANGTDVTLDEKGAYIKIV